MPVIVTRPNNRRRPALLSLILDDYRAQAFGRLVIIAVMRHISEPARASAANL